jgi:hypothetical protein
MRAPLKQLLRPERLRGYGPAPGRSLLRPDKDGPALRRPSAGAAHSPPARLLSMSRGRSQRAEPRRKGRTHSPSAELPHFVWLWFKDTKFEANYRQTWCFCKRLKNKAVIKYLSVDPLDKPKVRPKFVRSRLLVQKCVKSAFWRQEQRNLSKFVDGVSLYRFLSMIYFFKPYRGV